MPRSWDEPGVTLGVFLSPLRGWLNRRLQYPQLALWAGFLRRFAARDEMVLRPFRTFKVKIPLPSSVHEPLLLDQDFHSKAILIDSVEQAIPIEVTNYKSLFAPRVVRRILRLWRLEGAVTVP
jgi:hypothetical protein